ncbi:MAG TPA: LysR family transcriptional regulator [Kofleriaceae bacterium]
MDFNDLALFARVVEHGSFTAAAKAMALPKSSVTRGIARLEKGLGVRLIQRTTRQRGVTDAGRELYERVRGAVGALEEATEAVREQGKEPRGIVRVTANPDAAMMEIPQMLVELRAKLPSIHIELILTSRVVDLVAEGIDLAIRAGHLVDSSLIAKKIGQSDLGLYAAKTYLKKRGRPKKIGELADHDLILFRGRNAHATWTFNQPREQRIEVEGVASVDDFWFMSRTLDAGIGIGPLPSFMAHQTQTLERVLPELTMGGTPVQIVMPSASYVPALVAAVRDFLHERLTHVMNLCDRR